MHGGDPHTFHRGVGAVFEQHQRDAGVLEAVGGPAAELAEAGGHRDVGRFDARVQPLANLVNQGIQLLRLGAGGDQDGPAAAQSGTVVGQRVDALVQGFDALSGHDARRPGEDLLGAAVVEAQPRRPAGDVDAEGAQRHPGVVDALVGVTGDEQVIALLGDGVTQHPPLRRVQVLGLVHHHMPVAGAVGGQQLGRPQA